MLNFLHLHVVFLAKAAFRAEECILTSVLAEAVMPSIELSSMTPSASEISQSRVLDLRYVSFPVKCRVKEKS